MGTLHRHIQNEMIVLLRIIPIVTNIPPLILNDEEASLLLAVSITFPFSSTSLNSEVFNGVAATSGLPVVGDDVADVGSVLIVGLLEILGVDVGDTLGRKLGVFVG